MRRILVGGLILAAAAVAILFWHSRPPRGDDDPHRDPEKVASPTSLVFTGDALTRQRLLGALALVPGHGIPASYPWVSIHEIGDRGLFPLEALLHYDPVAFLESCQAKYRREVTGYTCTFRKQERVKGKLLDPEKIEIHFRENPFAVHMHFLQGGSAQKVVYPDGDNYDNLAARPRFPSFFAVSRKIDGPDAMKASRFPINQFGIAKGTESTLDSMRRAQARGALYVRYEGVFKVPELGDRACYKLVRTPYVPPEEDELNELTLYIDTEYLLQTGSVLKDVRGELISEYYFRDLRLNPEFNKDQFTRKAL
ncbi:MAG: DUF1571 domain-containing protein [Gemmataceae bacterium]|nr:DUF1571 domain-containing protein [Gemmataceae bacterium]